MPKPDSIENPQGQNNENLFDKFLSDTLGLPDHDPYPEIDEEVIKKAERIDPLQAGLMDLANAVLSEVRAQAEGEKDREPTYHPMGWKITLVTDRGVVGIKNNWLGNELYIGYPTDVQISSDLIKEVLGVKDSLPVDCVDATAVNNWDYEGRFKDDDKPLEESPTGQILAFTTRPDRQWAPFYGPIENMGGRVWIDHRDFHSNLEMFEYIDTDGNVAEQPHGQRKSMSIATFPFSVYNKYAYEGPTSDEDAIQRYREKFIRLAVEIAKTIGTVQSISIDYGQVFVPEDLEKEGFEDLTWKKGGWGQRKGFNQEHIMAKKEGLAVSLLSKNELVPWRTLVSYEIASEEQDNLSGLIIDELLYL